MKNAVSILVNGRRFSGWKSVHIEMGIEQVARAFALQVTEKLPGQTSYSNFQSGSVVEIYIGSDLVCTGYITSTPVSYNGNSITVTIQGKSKTVDLVDCCPPAAAVKTSSSEGWAGVKGKSGKAVSAPSQAATSWKEQPTSKILAALTSAYGITVQDEVGAGDKLANHTVNPGETVVESINRLISKDNLLVTDDEKGNLVITEPGARGSCSNSLVLGENILSGKADFDFSKRFSTYTVLGQHKQQDSDNSKTAASDKGDVTDTEVKRYRLKVIKDSGQSSIELCKRRADYTMRYTRAQSRKATYTIQGWRQKNGDLWPLNAWISVSDSILGLERQMVTSMISYDLSNSGAITTLECCDAEGLMREPKDAKSGDGTSWQGIK